MRRFSQEFSIERMASALGVSRSGYYAWVKNSQRSAKGYRKEFDQLVRSIFDRSKQRYGSVRITQELRLQGIPCGRHCVNRSMRRQKLRARSVRTYVPTTDSNHLYRVAENLLNREFHVEVPDRVWVSDITYLPCRNGWLYLVVFLDLFSRKVIGWHVSHSLKHETVLAAFHRAIRRRGPVAGLVVHSDRGVQYCCDGFRNEMQLHGVRQSMSRKGNCWDNAVMESFFATLKKEFPDRQVFSHLADAERYLFEYIEIDYNNHHRHSTLAFRTPIEMEQHYWDSIQEETRNVA